MADRIDELLLVLGRAIEDLRSISSSLKSLNVSQETEKPLRTLASVGISEEDQEKIQSIKDVRVMFPEELDVLLDFEEKEKYIIVKPKQFLGSENFAKIASIIRGMDGEYISAGRNSHFRVYTKKI